MADEGTEEQPAATVLSRLVSAGIEESRARGLIESGAIRAGGDPVTDPAALLPWPTRWVVAPL